MSLAEQIYTVKTDRIPAKAKANLARYGGKDTRGTLFPSSPEDRQSDASLLQVTRKG